MKNINKLYSFKKYGDPLKGRRRYGHYEKHGGRQATGVEEGVKMLDVENLWGKICWMLLNKFDS